MYEKLFTSLSFTGEEWRTHNYPSKNSSPDLCIINTPLLKALIDILQNYHASAKSVQNKFCSSLQLRWNHPYYSSYYDYQEKLFNKKLKHIPTCTSKFCISISTTFNHTSQYIYLRKYDWNNNNSLGMCDFVFHGFQKVSFLGNNKGPPCQSTSSPRLLAIYWSFIVLGCLPWKGANKMGKTIWENVHGWLWRTFQVRQ